MTTPPPWPATSVPTPPAPSGYEAKPTLVATGDDNPFAAPAPERPAGSGAARAGYLAQTYPADGYAPTPDEWAHPVPAVAHPQPPVTGYPQPHPGPAPAGQPYGAQPYGAQPYGAQPYGAQPYGGQPVPYPFAPGAAVPWAPPPPNDPMSVAALVVGLVSLFTGLFIGGPVAVGLGIVGMRRTSGGAASGRGMAVAGIVTGALATVALALFALVMGAAIWGEL